VLLDSSIHRQVPVPQAKMRVARYPRARDGESRISAGSCRQSILFGRA